MNEPAIPDLINIDKPIVVGYPPADIVAVGELLLKLGGSMNPTDSHRGRLLWNLGSWLCEVGE